MISSTVHWFQRRSLPDLSQRACCAWMAKKRPDGMSIIPWTSGRLLVWDATCSDTFAASNIHAAVTEAGAEAAQAELNKISKYSHLDSTYLFVPVAIETCGPFGPKAWEFFQELGRRMKRATQEEKAHEYLMQRIAVAVQAWECRICPGDHGKSTERPI